MSQVIDRGDGRIEITCRHGVGHPSRKISAQLYEHWDDGWMGVHGCDGCCGGEDWKKDENTAYRTWMKDGDFGAMEDDFVE